MNHEFATIVTRIFDPFITLTVLFILALIKSSLTYDCTNSMVLSFRYY